MKESGYQLSPFKYYKDYTPNKTKRDKNAKFDDVFLRNTDEIEKG